MGIFSSILGICSGVVSIISGWCGGYNSKENQKARIESEKTSKKDALNKSIADADVDDERRRLG